MSWRLLLSLLTRSVARLVKAMKVPSPLIAGSNEAKLPLPVPAPLRLTRATVPAVR